MITSLKFSMNYTSHTSPWRNFHAWLSHMYIDQFKTINNRWPVVISIAYLFSKKGHLFVNFLFLSFDEVCALIRRVTYFEIKSMHSKALLWELRTSLPMFHVLQELEDKLHIPFKESEGFIRFLCPFCNEMQATINPKNNLSHCFVCKRNLNNIDLMILSGYTFFESVKILNLLWNEFNKKTRSKNQLKPGNNNTPPTSKEIYHDER